MKTLQKLERERDEIYIRQRKEINQLDDKQVGEMKNLRASHIAELKPVSLKIQKIWNSVAKAKLEGNHTTEEGRDPVDYESEIKDLREQIHQLIQQHNALQAAYEKLGGKIVHAGDLTGEEPK